jgi:hypothetical protein
MEEVVSRNYRNIIEVKVDTYGFGLGEDVVNLRFDLEEEVADGRTKKT